jgi:penicillin-binding protein 2
MDVNLSGNFMFHQRLKIFISICVLGMFVCLGRLWYLQSSESQTAREQIERLRILAPLQLPTLRGNIVDRNERVLAKEQPFFFLQVNYELIRLLDDRFRQAHIQALAGEGLDAQAAEEKLASDWADDIEQLEKVVNFCIYTAGIREEDLYQRLGAVNDRMWELGRFIYWRRQSPGVPLSRYVEQKESIKPAQVLSVDLQEMHQGYSILELEDRKILMAAQLELAGIPRVTIRSESQRVYPFGRAASQLIGWVGLVRSEEVSRLFSDDEYLQYLDGEVIGKHGIEKCCEAVLRGRRGEVTYDRQKNELSRTNPHFGQDVQLTLDIALQQQIQDLLSDPNAVAPEFRGTGRIAAVVLDAAAADILAMVSLPAFDLNRAREDYSKLLVNPARPLRNHTMEDTFPPGSTIKPLILLAGLEEKKITANDVIHCSWTLPSESWPKCLLQRKSYCHDARWEEEGQINNARNALRGSCNVYFSRLADRLDGNDLQTWLWRFGYGRQILGPCVYESPFESPDGYQLRESPGSIIFGIQQDSIEDIAKAPAIPIGEKRWWGIGQGNLRTTVLQVANAYAILARRGLVKSPRIIIDPNDPMNEKRCRQLPVHSENLAVVYDGMHAVVNERGGSAYSAFSESGLNDLGMTIYGKTGSTERPYCAWFAAFVTDYAGRAISLAVVVEGGQSGANDAAPLAREIIRLCNQAGFIGRTPGNLSSSISK